MHSLRTRNGPSDDPKNSRRRSWARSTWPWKGSGTAEHAYAGVRFQTHRNVYDPSDDTYLQLDHIPVEAGQRFLEVGCGAGLVAIRAAQLGANVVATDLNPHALELARKNAVLNGVRIEFVRADLTGPLRLSRFDAVSFNPPYLPTADGDRVPGILNRAFDGGPTGLDTVARFLRQVGAAPTKATWLVVSSLQPGADFAKLLFRASLDASTIATKRLSHETLTLLRLSPRAR